jgi:hypothetical protein
MIQRGGGLRFLKKSPPLVAVAASAGGKEFESGRPLEEHIAGLVDHAHSAFAELIEDFVMADGGPGHGDDDNKLARPLYLSPLT